MGFSVKQCLVLLAIVALVAVEIEARPADSDSWTSWISSQASTALDYSKDKAQTGWSYLKKGAKHTVTATRKGLQQLEEKMKNVDTD